MDLALDTAGQRAGVIAMAGFLVSFGFIRFSTRMMRSPRFPWWPGSIKTEGIHVHHLVFGIVLMIVSGFATFAAAPGSPWFEILAGAFGIGVGLTVDEFALWLYLEDVYWTDEGRASVDAAIVCAAVGGLLLLGFGPSYSGPPGGVALLVAEQVACVAVIVAKGKARLAIFALLIPFLGWIVAIRLARPNSWWGRRFYRPGSPKLAKAAARAARWDARRVRWLDRIGGAPSLARGDQQPHDPPGQE